MTATCTVRRLEFLLLLLLASSVSVSGLDDTLEPLPSPGRFSLLRVVEKSLAGTAGVVRGVGDAIAVGTGGTIRMLGGSIQTVGGSLEGLGDAVAGESPEDDEWGEPGSVDINGALRAVASRPIRIFGRALRAVGDTTNFFGDTTERMAADVMGILPDTVRIVESSVRAVRHNIDNEYDDAHFGAGEGRAVSGGGSRRVDYERGPASHGQRRGGGAANGGIGRVAGEKAAFGAGSQGERIGLELRRSIESLEAGRGSGSIAGARSLEPTKRPSSTTSTKVLSKIF